MKKLFSTIVCAMALFAMTSCSKDDPWDGKQSVVKVNTKFASAGLDASKIEGVKVNFVDVNTQESTTSTFKGGVCDINVVPGVYNIVVESDVKDKVRYCAAQENVTIKDQNTTLELLIKAFPAVINNDGFIISEYFFNGERNSGWMMHPDQYIVVHNSSLTTKYADGLSFATADQFSVSKPEPYLASIINEKVAIIGFFTIPGDGKKFPVKPGEEIVIAMTATDHSAIKTTITDREGVVHEVSYDYAANLTGADFEWYNPDPESKDIDNPGVANVIATSGTWDGYGAYMHPRGFYSAVLFQLKDGQPATIEEFHKANTTIYKYPDTTDKEGNKVEGQEINLTCVPNNMVKDAICTGDRPLVTRPFSESLDRGFFSVAGCHRQELARRKVVKVDGADYFQDTNNTTDDFEKVFGQYHYPIGWRDNGSRKQVKYIGSKAGVSAAAGFQKIAAPIQRAN